MLSRHSFLTTFMLEPRSLNLDLVKNFNVGEALNLQFDAQKLYAFSADGNLVSSPFQEFGRG